MNNAAKPLLEARAVHKSYKMGRGELHVLRGIDLVVNAGEFLALRGSSGAGKSTLLHLLGGLDLPNQGEVLFDGNNLRSLSGGKLAELRNRRASFIFQAYHLLPELNAIENVCLPGRIARRDTDEVMSRAQELMARVGLGNRTTHRPYELSGGERQRVAIARSLINSPDLVLADEPTGNLDSHTGEGIIDLLCALRDEGTMTLVIATHDAKIAARAPRVIQLVDGKITNSP